MDDKQDRELREAIEDIFIGLEAEEERMRAYKEKKYWQEITLPFGLQNGLERLTKDDLNDIRRKLNLVGLSSLNKGQLIKKLTEIIPEKLFDTLFLLDEERYRLLKKAAHNQGVVPIEDTFSLEKVESFWKRGILFPAIHAGRKVLVMPTELQERFLKVDNQDVQKVIKRNTEWIQLSYGMLFYYGILARTQLKLLLGRYGIEVEDNIHFHQVLSSSIDYYGWIENQTAGYIHLDVDDGRALLDAQLQRDEIDYYPFTKQQLRKASAPNFIEKTPEVKAFMEFIHDYYEISQKDLDGITAELICIVKNGENLNEGIEFLQIIFESPTMEFLQELVDKVAVLHNNTRMWMLKGYTPIEVRKKRELQESKDSNVIDFASRKKIGRNDPCPCGSGKKYKKCCGK
ncbi:YecA family protein [Salirhabdus sp. Marseille-P4669]|uniref:YecA family protein n=1 Tax=Salirhabdus sp. Marseille-P4669 TaxID=2042310 RepID=UPI000C7B23C9|nr:SEC-C metal-binding domain-containing protein [Salirhabdus sp. Marseille-P4669]